MVILMVQSYVGQENFSRRIAFRNGTKRCWFI